MSLEKLSKYKINSAYTNGVAITLDDAPDVTFMVRLPGQYNRAYMAEVYGAIDFDFTDEGEVSAKTNIVQAREMQEKAFIKHCIISLDGEPLPEGFAEDYPDALSELMAKANKLLEAMNNTVEEGAKKSQTLSTGSISGVIG